MKHLVLKGSPRERGRAHGEELRREIRELSEIRWELVRGYFKDRPLIEIERLNLKQIEFLKAYPDLYDEFCGIAEGARMGLADLVVVNNYTDMRDYSALPSDEGCSTLSVRTPTETFCGQTWDMHASARPYVIHMTIHEGGQKREILTLAGNLALAGVNPQGVSVLINNLHTREPQIGLLWPALVRGMLRMRTAREALQYLQENLPCSGHNYVICDPTESYNVETTGKRWEITAQLSSEGETGAFFHTNHYVGKLKSTEIESRVSASTRPRYEEIDKYFKSRPIEEITPKGVLEDVLDGQVAKSVCILPGKSTPHASATCGGILLDLKRREGISFGGPYREGDVYRFRWEGV